MPPTPQSAPPDTLQQTPERALSDTPTLFALLDRWVARGWLRRLDRAFTAFLHREVPDAPPLLLLAAALASHQLGRGHVCLDLAQTLATPDLALSLPPEGDSLEDPPPLPSRVMTGLDLDSWRTALTQPELVASGPGGTPLVLAGSRERPRLYLRRYWQYEQDIHTRIVERLDNDALPAEARAATDATRLRPVLDALFPQPEVADHDDAGPPLDWQKAACALAVRARFAVITGGPGTGKTTTVVRLLALLQARALSANPPAQADGEPEGPRALRIRLAAPTGKAAARLNESIAGQVATLALDGLADDAERLREAIPTEVSTLHRLLGSRPDTRRFRHHRHNPLPLDVLVVDEASMVDVGMMAALLDALPPQARLVLLGDKDQLASVEAGAVLGDLCARAEGGHYTPATAEWLVQATGQALPPATLDAEGEPLDQAIAMLRVSHRFTADSGIGQLAAAINADFEAAAKRHTIRDVLNHGYADLSHLKLANDDERGLARLAVTGSPEHFPAAGRTTTAPMGYRHFLSVMAEQRPADSAPQEAFDHWARQVLTAHGDFQLLCALRRGPWGVEGLNERVRQALEGEKLIDSQQGRQRWYAGRPVLVTKNDYGLGLMNGDIGITLEVPHPDAANSDDGRRLLRVAFPANDGTDRIKWVLPSRLQSVETVLAMTVHKSQGSEFTHAALVLPDAPNPILTRELIYTGITRARRWLTLVETGRGQLMDAAQRRVMRVSGLGG
nr:exodeoxyribonuclease V subunit alpha [Kushneria aurantia]